MDTSPRSHHVETHSAAGNAEVEGFFDTLRTAQSSFMATVGHAHSLLGRESGQLAHVAAIQGRLTRQFFDAQRAIMMRRAEVDAEVAFIGSVTEDEAGARVAAARTQAGDVTALPVMARAAAPVEFSYADPAPVHRSARQEIAALGVAVVRTMSEADSLAAVIDEAFEPDEPDGAAAQRQLTSLLDEWWRVENQEGRAVVEDARARAAMRQHVATIEAREIIGAAHGPDTRTEVVVTQYDPSPLLPSHMVAALDRADVDGLQSLLATLADSLDSPPSERTLVEGPRNRDLVILLDRVEAPRRVIEVAPEDAFRRFWDKGSAPVTSRRNWRWIPTQVVLPMTAVTSALALLLAWIG